MRAIVFELSVVAALLCASASAAEFDMTYAYGLAEYGASVRTDCSDQWTNPESGKTYCFSNNRAKQDFLKDPKRNIHRAEDVFARLAKKP